MTGRPTKYSDDVIEAICTRLASGESLIKICTDPKMPARSTVFGWLVKTEKRSFLDKYLAARSIAGHACADRLLGLVDDLESGEVEPQIAREMSSNLRWSAERMAPRYYSPKQAIAINDNNQISHEEWLNFLE